MKGKKRPGLKAGGLMDSFKSLSFYQIVASAAFFVVASFSVYGLLNSIAPKTQESKKDVDVEVTSKSPTLSPTVSLSVPSISPTSSTPITFGTVPSSIPQSFAYNLVGQSGFIPSERLKPVVDSIIQYCKNKSLPTSALSITLIDTKTGEISEYQGTTQRYPASVVKMFWLVAVYQKISRGELNESALRPAIEQMIFKSDNQGASQVLDAVTGTKSTTDKLSDKELAISKQKRQELNSFFNRAGYNQNINISQKTFPIPQENIMEPKGFDQQLRGDNIEQPIRNKITTNDAARLMYEIVDAKSVSPEISLKMRGLLTRNIDPGFWKKQPPNPVDFNPVESFFGEGLPEGKTENIVSKAGWTSVSRQEVAFVKSKDGKTRYILAVFGDDAAYGKSKKVFPEIANMVYQKMRSNSIVKK
jgi:beta-lactamase class A